MPSRKSKREKAKECEESFTASQHLKSRGHQANSKRTEEDCSYEMKTVVDHG